MVWYRNSIICKKLKNNAAWYIACHAAWYTNMGLERRQDMSLYTTGELAKKCNVSVRTIQYYDERGILVPTDLTEGGRRLFSEKDVATLETICFLRDLDISIKDIAEILESDESKKVIELLLDELNKTFRQILRKKQSN